MKYRLAKDIPGYDAGYIYDDDSPFIGLFGIEYIDQAFRMDSNKVWFKPVED